MVFLIHVDRPLLLNPWLGLSRLEGRRSVRVGVLLPVKEKAYASSISRRRSGDAGRDGGLSGTAAEAFVGGSHRRKGKGVGQVADGGVATGGPGRSVLQWRRLLPARGPDRRRPAH